MCIRNGEERGLTAAEFKVVQGEGWEKQYQYKVALLLNQSNCADNHGMEKIKQHITSMESSLEALNQQEEKYTAELDAALAQYAELQQQAADVNTMELDTARHAIRLDKEREAVQGLRLLIERILILTC